MNISISVNSNTGDISSLVQKITDRLPQAIMAGAEAVADTARGMCPVDTGTLKGSIDVSGNGNSAEVFAEADYAVYVEFGTYKMAAQPFLAPALTSTDVISAISGGLGI